jgi:Ran GTPase-activating protein (RanGAP) involved in mRNA processing and transport
MDGQIRSIAIYCHPNITKKRIHQQCFFHHPSFLPSYKEIMTWGSGGLKSCDGLLQRVQDNDERLESIVILPIKTFGATQVERLAEILSMGNNTFLTSISASGHCVPPAALAKLGAALASKGGSKIRYISIGDETTRDDGVEAFCTALAEAGGSLEHVDFGFKNLSPLGTAVIGKVFGPSGIRKLELYRNPDIGSDGMATFSKSASSASSASNRQPFQALELLDISECNVGAEGIHALADCLIVLENDQRSKPIDLNASRNPLTSDASLSLGRLISTNTISRLSIKSCGLRDDGVSSLMDSFKAGPSSITFLDLAQNDMTVRGAKALASILKSQKDNLPHLAELNLSGNKEISSEGVVALANALQGPDGNTTVKVLDLGSTTCGIDGAVAILQCPSLVSLRLFDNNMGSEGLEAVALHLEGGHSTLEHLDLGGNRATEPAVVSLLRAIRMKREPDDSVLHTLELGGNQGGDDIERILQEMKTVRPGLDVARDKPAARQQQQPNGGLFQNMQTSLVNE